MSAGTTPPTTTTNRTTLALNFICFQSSRTVRRPVRLTPAGTAHARTPRSSVLSRAPAPTCPPAFFSSKNITPARRTAFWRPSTSQVGLCIASTPCARPASRVRIKPTIHLALPSSCKHVFTCAEHASSFTPPADRLPPSSRALIAQSISVFRAALNSAPDSENEALLGTPAPLDASPSALHVYDGRVLGNAGVDSDARRAGRGRRSRATRRTVFGDIFLSALDHARALASRGSVSPHVSLHNIGLVGSPPRYGVFRQLIARFAGRSSIYSNTPGRPPVHRGRLHAHRALGAFLLDPPMRVNCCRRARRCGYNGRRRRALTRTDLRARGAEGESWIETMLWVVRDTMRGVQWAIRVRQGGVTDGADAQRYLFSGLYNARARWAAGTWTAVHAADRALPRARRRRTLPRRRKRALQ
ncbi:hypothetical protein HYPSUDRAFT_204582 [Hypholoma sublateritium FD-334 SS-4]|uniref:Uncharacterized protein n=1 Tax=Hypholoma sublateritium (strain FD-334 SS-4) TaxID=945553 RepID=A0A0D2NKD6_HYPSF|nr:hypothetical protein HYPSUDRAFT_204582 [Hypholoma sublateritium FD-334 SS-4]